MTVDPLKLSFVDTMTSDSHGPIVDNDAAACLRVVFPPELAQSGPCTNLHGAGALLGRTPLQGATVVLGHATVSRRHAQLMWDAATDCHLLADLGSHNGTSVNDTPLEFATPPPGEPRRGTPLESGDVVRVGDVVLVYERGRIPDGAGDVIKALPGDALAMRELRALVARAATDPSAALVIGETGTGKEYVARTLHERSGRSGAFVALNCAALSPQLVEAQLFGHVKGAYTGASSAGEGLFRAAQGGTLFLDEIGELPLELQPKLLRVLQERRVRPVGGTRELSVDVRVVAATNRELTAMVGEDRFRRDLYARLSLTEIRVPALRSRRADILTWVDRMRARWCQERGVDAPGPTFAPESAVAALCARWPDNLRGIDRLVHRHAHARRPLSAQDVGAAADLITVRESQGTPTSDRHVHAPAGAAHAPSAPVAAGSADPSRHRRGADDIAVTQTSSQGSRPQTPAAKPPARPRRPSPSREELVAALRRTGSVRATAKHFDRDRRQIYRWIRSHDIGDDEYALTE